MYFGGDFRAEQSLVLSSYVVIFIEWAILIENKCECSGFVDNGYGLIVDLLVGQKDWASIRRNLPMRNWTWPKKSLNLSTDSSLQICRRSSIGTLRKDAMSGESGVKAMSRRSAAS